jgi:hypothetical protein
MMPALRLTAAVRENPRVPDTAIRPPLLDNSRSPRLMTMTPMLDELRTLGECGARGASVAGMRMLAGTTLGLSGDGDEPRAVSARTETTTTTGMRFTKDLLGKSSSAHHSSATAIPIAAGRRCFVAQNHQNACRPALHAANTCSVRGRDDARRHLHPGRCSLLRKPLLEVGIARPSARRHGDVCWSIAPPKREEPRCTPARIARTIQRTYGPSNSAPSYSSDRERLRMPLLRQRQGPARYRSGVVLLSPLRRLRPHLVASRAPAETAPECPSRGSDAAQGRTAFPHSGPPPSLKSRLRVSDS